MSNTEESVTWSECYRRFRAEGMGRIMSAYAGLALYSVTQMDHVKGLEDEDKWRDTSEQ